MVPWHMVAGGVQNMVAGGVQNFNGSDLVELCSACMVGKSAMYRVPEEVVARFQLQELGDEEYERVFGA